MIPEPRRAYGDDPSAAAASEGAPNRLGEVLSGEKKHVYSALPVFFFLLRR